MRETRGLVVVAAARLLVEEPMTDYDALVRRLDRFAVLLAASADEVSNEHPKWGDFQAASHVAAHLSLDVAAAIRSLQSEKQYAVDHAAEYALEVRRLESEVARLTRERDEAATAIKDYCRGECTGYGVRIVDGKPVGRHSPNCPADALGWLVEAPDAD